VGVPVELSVKFTEAPAHIEVLLAEKVAVGAVPAEGTYNGTSHIPRPNVAARSFPVAAYISICITMALGNPVL
jgi:hypothetical protein